MLFPEEKSQVYGKKLEALTSDVKISLGRLQEKENIRNLKVSEIADARSRVELEVEVTQFLRDFQNDVYRKDIQECSALLSALVKDVVPHGNNIELVLDTRGKNPILTIESVDANGGRYNILKDVGGSIKNVVAMGLRAIAVCKGNLRPLLVLDEPDHWVSPARSTAFFNKVASQLSKELNFQIFAISHHDSTLFSGQGTTLLRLDGLKETGVFVRVVEQGKSWENDSVSGIRGVTLKNFATYKDAFIPFGPGVTILSGDNDLGKSRVMRAMRAVFFGGSESSDATIRHGESSTEVTIHIENNKKIVWTRTPKKSPVMHWKMLDENNEVCNLNGVLCSGGGINGGKNPPEWVSEVLNIKKVDELDIQLAEQDKSLFILDDSISDIKKAKILSVGRESSYLDKIIERSGNDFKMDKMMINKGEKEVAKLIEEINHLSIAKKLDVNIKKLQDLLMYLTEENKKVEVCHDTIMYMEDYYEQLKFIEPLLEIKHDISFKGDLTSSIVKINEIQKLERRIYNNKSNMDSIFVLSSFSYKPENIILNKVGYLSSLIKDIENKTEQSKKNSMFANVDISVNIPNLPKVLLIEKTIQSLIKNKEKMNNIGDILNLNIPDLKEIENQNKKACFILNLNKNIEISTLKLESISDEIKQCEDEIKNIQIEIDDIMKDGCPLCGSIVGGHNHD